MKLTTLCLAVTAAAALVFGTGCGKKGAPAAADGASSSSSSSRSSGPDYSKPALTEAKMAKFIESINEDKNPFEVIFKQGGAMRSIADMKAKEAEYNAFAKKYGFADFTEYIDIWGRVMVGQMQIATDKMSKDMIASTEKSIREDEEKLKDPSLTPEARKEYTESLESNRKSLADLQKPSSDPASLNAADLALVAKYNDLINAALKKRKSS